MIRREMMLCFVALLTAGCVPDLTGWQVYDPDRDGGPPRSDATIGPVDDCSAPRPLGAGYSEGFEDGPGGWGIANEGTSAPSWQWGTPAQTRIDRAASGANAWMTRLDGNYFDYEDSYLVSPCFDASDTTGDLLLEMWRAYETERNYDWILVEYSVDGGDTWLPTFDGRLTGWYSGGSGWQGEQEWAPAATILPGTAGRSRVQVRVYFHSDAAQNFEGFAMDDVVLRQATADLSVELVEGERCGYADGTITNVGGLPITGFEVSTDVDGVTEIQTFDRLLAYRQTQSFTIGGALAQQTNVSLFSTADTNPANDAASVRHVTVPLGGGYFSDFETDDGGLVAGGHRSSWAWAEPGGELINTAASGSRAWFTNPTGDYGSGENSWIQTVCFDMSASTRDPEISLSRVFRTDESGDGAEVEVSVDGGSFRTIGGTSSGGTGWYNSSRYGWSGSSGAGAWGTARHPLTNTAGRAAVRVRIHFSADATTQFEGFGIDDLEINP